MKHSAPLLFAAFLVAAPAVANEDLDEGMNLLEEGAKLFMRGLMDEMEPALEDFALELEPALREFGGNIGPVFSELMRLIDDIGAYEMPEILPNGDIIIRRKPDMPMPLPGTEGNEIEL